MTARLSARFAALKAEGRAGLVAYVMAGDPNLEASWALLSRLPEAGADLVELGFPFTDPMADGPVIQAAGRRALAAKITLADTLSLAARFRAAWPDTPLILMGYANPIHHRSEAAFAKAAATAGVDGAIVVDLPPEEDDTLRTALAAHDLALIRLATPTSDDARLRVILENARGFLYYVSVTGVTGGAQGGGHAVSAAIKRVRRMSDVPVAVGFGVRTPDQARAFARHADAVVVGSAIVDAHERDGVEAALALTRDLAAAVRDARQGATT